MFTDVKHGLAFIDSPWAIQLITQGTNMLRPILCLLSLSLSFTIQADTFSTVSADVKSVQKQNEDGTPVNPNEGLVSLEPGLTVDDNTIKPKIVVSVKKPFFGSEDVSMLFDFSVNGGIDTGNYENPEESSDELITEYIADGGNIDIDVGLGYSPVKDIYIGIGGFYSLLTADAISTEQGASEVVDVDAEIYGYKLFALYDIKAVRVFGSITDYNTSDEGQADFTKILDNGHATSVGLEVPLSWSADNFGEGNSVIKLERTKHSNVDKAIFRVSIAIPFKT